MKKYLQLLILLLFEIYPGCAQNPVLWGMTSSGDSMGGGTIFSYNPGTGIFTLEYSFTNGLATGCTPIGTLIQASDHQLYGLTSRCASGNGGSIFSYNIATGVLTDLHDFYPDSTNGYTPLGSLFQASNGLLYGTTTIGGANHSGILFSYNIISHQFRDVYDFPNTESGSLAYTSLIQAGDSLLYGVQVDGPGTFGVGYIYSYNIYTDSVKILYQFGAGNDGYSPEGAFVQAANGLLYIMTAGGGIDYDGAICSFNPATNHENPVYSFGANFNDGYGAIGSLIRGGDSLLYGMTAGSESGSGILFSFDTHNDAETILYQFTDSLHGVSPRGSLLLASNGFLYGMTSGGGLYNGGAVFSFDTMTGVEMVLHSFNDTDGLYPMGSLIEVFDTFSNCTMGYSNVSLLICAGDTAYVGPYKYTQPGTYIDTITNLAGCDSIITLNLTINPVYQDTLVLIASRGDTICSGDTVTFTVLPGGQGQYQFYVGASLQQDSTVNTWSTGQLSNDNIIWASITQGGCTGFASNRDTMVVNPTPFVFITPTDPSADSSSNGSATVSSSVGQSSYMWNNGDTSQTITNLGTGTYYVTVTAGACRVVDSIVLVATGIQTLHQNCFITLYPNPATDLIYIKTEGIQAQTTNIYDVNGQLVYTGRFTPQLDVSKLTAGAYLIEVTAPEGEARRVFVKM